MPAFSGKDGTVKAGSSEIAEITNWRWNRKSNVTKYGSNSTAGYKAAVPGTKEGSGSFDFKLVSGATTGVNEGESVTLFLSTNGTDGWTVPAVIGEVEVECDIDNGEPVGGSASFEANGAWS